MKYRSSYLIIVIGLIYLVTIHFFIKEEVFFSEDGGIKMLMMKQYLNGNLGNTLVVDAPSWAYELWDQGLYYFTNPFVYKTPSGNMPVFPPYFAMLTAPLYNLFGFHGLYIIPALSLIALWFLFIKICKDLQLSGRATFLSIVMLVLASSLTFYASIFWEHTLAVLCCFIGFYFVIRTELEKKNSFLICLLFGLASGMALWFRPESIFIILLLLIWSFYRLLISRKASHYFFIAGITFSLLVFFTYNYYLYESFTGLHSKQITEQVNLVERVKQIGYIFLVLLAKTALYDPIILIVITIAFILRKEIMQDFKSGKPLVGMLFITVAFFYIVSPIILPNTGGRNWGIRYALVCIPVFYISAAILFDKILESKFKTIVYVGVFVLAGYGIFQNIYNGSKVLYANYNGGKTKVIDYLQSNPSSIVLLTKSYQAAEFEVLAPQSLFFKTETKEALDTFLSRPEIHDYKVTLLYDLGDNKYKELELKPEHLKGFRKLKEIDSFVLYELDLKAKSEGN